MPLQIHVGANRKIADGRYGSCGASLNLEVELDGSLILTPSKLRDRVRELFAFVRQALREELSVTEPPPEDNVPGDASTPCASIGPPTNGHVQNGAAWPATAAQIRALHAITREQHLDLKEILHTQYGLERPDELSLDQASEVIDFLKSTDA